MPGTHAFGTTFSWNSVVIAGLTAINGIELSVDTIDVTTHQSANYYKEILPGLIDPGEVSIEGQFEFTDVSGQQAMLSDLNSRTARTGVITFPAATGSTWTFQGYITNLKIGDAPIDDKIPFSATIKPTGKPVFAVATSTGLSALVISNSAVLAPAFAASTIDYVASVLTGIASVTITPTASAGTITITANGASQVVASGTASSAIALGSAVSVTIVTITVQETNKAPKVYTIRINRP
jgi:predicted secreted protein